MRTDYEAELSDVVDLNYFWNQEFDHSDYEANPDLFKVPVEYKADSFGWLNGKIVAIDYGS